MTNVHDGDTHFHDDDRYYEDEQLDAMHRDYLAKLDADDAARNDAAASDDDTDLDCVCEAARVQRERADAELAEADRLDALVESTAAKVAGGNMAAVDAITGIFTRKVG